MAVDGHQQFSVEGMEEHSMAIVVGRNGEWLMLPRTVNLACGGIGYTLYVASAMPAGPYHT